MTRRLFAFVLAVAAVIGVAPAAHAEPLRLTFRRYLEEVGRGSLDLAVQRAQVSQTQAQIAVARVFPDPTITGGLLQYDTGQVGNPTATYAQLNVPLQIGGQRGARTAFAEANLSAAHADLDDVLRGIRAAAANAYIDALHARLVVGRKQKTLESLTNLVAVNEERLRAGDIGEATVLQSRVEANQFRAGVLDGEGAVRVADLALVQLLGRGATGLAGRPLVVEGDLRAAADRTFDPEALLRTAMRLRPDLVAARRRYAAAQKQIDLARANRVIDIGVGAYWQHNFAVAGAFAAPATDLVGASITVPLPFSRIYRGELQAAYATETQADAAARAVEVKVDVEIRQAIAKYEAAAARVKLYTGGMLQDADRVLEKTLYNFQRGGASLVEVLVAQRTDNEVYLSYFDALADAAHALVAVQQAVGTWDVDF